MIALVRSEATKLLTTKAVWILAIVAVLATWPMSMTNSATPPNLPADSELLFSSAPIPLDYQGFEMAGFGYVLVVAIASLWAGSEYGGDGQIRTTLLATPKRLRVFLVKIALLAFVVAVTGFLTMTGALVITHAVGEAGINPWALTPVIWANIGGVVLAWTFTALIAFAVGTIARTAILPLILISPLVIGVGDFLVGLWPGAKALPTTAGASLYSDPATGLFLEPALGGLIQATWAAVLVAIAAVTFTRRDL
ncbi:hypothetical protein GCM10009860_20220 [Microbacterium mitrae]|uniref:Uncharacterized protein n=1 Tax=Microbacterium mitrae TaxID=664640 RepID=A0A5C8HN80_9MICO|nr:ABC transporter permease [Microbacterium mitrae]TXK04469.1 hypothetical protein FVP60_07150 [Microbacterium mitrae]